MIKKNEKKLEENCNCPKKMKNCNFPRVFFIIFHFFIVFHVFMFLSGFIFLLPVVELVKNDF